MKILFCTDGSKISFNAIRSFSHWVKDAIVDIICVIDWSFLPDEVSIENTGFASSCANIADNILNNAEDEIIKVGLTAGERIKHCGGVVDAIIEQIKNENYDLVVMGSHGKKGIQKWLGSVSREVLDNNMTSTYISKSPHEANRLLITIDGYHSAAEAIEGFLPKLNLIDKEIYVCMVNEDPNFLFLEGNIDSNWLIQIEKNQEQYAAKRLSKVRNALNERGLSIIESAILVGIPAQEILKYAKDKSIDLIVTGTKSKNKIDSFLNGSVSRRVLENTNSDVLIIKN